MNKNYQEILELIKELHSMGASKIKIADVSVSFNSNSLFPYTIEEPEIGNNSNYKENKEYEEETLFYSATR